MKKVVAMKWIKALKSGEYKQGKAFLQNQGKFCCLGVLCKIAEKEKINVLYCDDEIYGATLDRQKFVINWSGLKTNFGLLPKKSKLFHLTLLNDGGITFEKIAKIIKKYWRYL